MHPALLLAVTVAWTPLAQERFLSEAAQTAPVIVYGQIERLARSPGTTIATMRVAYSARGSTGPSVDFEALNSQHAEVVTLGMRALVFLEPRDDGAHLGVAANGRGVLPAFAAEGQPYLVRGRHDPQFPIELCSRTASNMQCAARLQDLLRSVGLPPFNPPDAGEATFQMISFACEPCLLEPWLSRYSDADAIDCAVASADAGVAATYGCVRDAVKRRAAFKAVMKDPADPLGRTAFMSHEGKWYELYFTGRVDGDCSAQAQVTECRALRVRLGKRPEIECGDRQDLQILCSQRRARTESLEPSVPVSRLRCAQAAGDGFLQCAMGPAGAGDVKPPSKGADLICRPDGQRACRPVY